MSLQQVIMLGHMLPHHACITHPGTDKRINFDKTKQFVVNDSTPLHQKGGAAVHHAW